MRVYSDCYELMSETGRNLWEMGAEVRPLSYQNKDISGDDNFLTKELICEQYCLTSLEQEDALFIYSKSRDWAKAELNERLAETVLINPGDAWKLRPDLWEQFLNKMGYFDYTYNERFHNGGKLRLIIDELKRNPDTRQAVLMVYHSKDVNYIGGKRRVPCSMYYDFLIRKDAKGDPQLNICYHQRSSDFITHFGNDVWLAFKLMEFVAEQVKVKPGYLYHTIDSLHSYKKDWTSLKTSISELL